MIAFFGMGMLGSGFVRALRKRGEGVSVWNRSPDKARALEPSGAKAFEDPVQAAQGATRVHLTLSDDAAVDDVLARASAGFDPKVVIVDHTTTTATGARKRAEQWAARGIAFVHAPVFMGPQNALESTGTMLISGPRERYEALAPELGKMTGKLVYLGTEPDRAAAFKLLGNLFLMALTAGVADMLALAKALDVPAAEAVGLFEFFNPGGVVGQRAKRMIEGDFSHPSWELAMARKDARLMQDEAVHASVPLAVIPAIAAEMQRWIDRGHAHDDWTVIAKDALERR
jgi:3-hydroxyisobutyrate dehydrogenase